VKDTSSKSLLSWFAKARTSFVKLILRSLLFQFAKVLFGCRHDNEEFNFTCYHCFSFQR
jgi:hypothetical protein